MTAPLALLFNSCIDAASTPLRYDALPSDKVVAGQPQVGVAELPDLGGCAIGVWEISPSVSTDVEVDEVFVVLFGEATVTFADGTPDLELTAGSLGRLQHGARTTWHVRKTLRKVYVAARP